HLGRSLTDFDRINLNGLVFTMDFEVKAFHEQRPQHQRDLLVRSAGGHSRDDIETVRGSFGSSIQKTWTLHLRCADAIGEHDEVTKSYVDESQIVVATDVEARRNSVDESLVGVGEANACHFELGIVGLLGEGYPARRERGYNADEQQQSRGGSHNLYRS